ncbi:MAG: hypothetical protein ABW220_00165, partial [Burkholderiaceae bacterium]
MRFPHFDVFRRNLVGPGAEGGQAETQRSLPPGTPAAIDKHWNSCRKTARSILEDLNRFTDAARKDKQVVGIEGRALARSPEFPVERRSRVTLTHEALRGIANALDASDVGNNCLILSQPDKEDALAIGALALERNIMMWVDARTEAERRQGSHCVDEQVANNKRFDGVTFTGLVDSPHPMDHICRGANLMRQPVKLWLGGHPVEPHHLGWQVKPRKDKEKDKPKGEERKPEPARQPMLRLNVPIDPKYAISPDVLVGLMPYIGTPREEAHSSVVFQCT